MSLTAVTQFIKKYTGIIIASIAIIALVVIAVNIYINQKESKIPLLTRPQLGLFQTKIKNVDTQKLTPPEKPTFLLPVFNVSPGNDFLKDSAQLSSKFNITKPPIPTNDAILGKGYIYADENSALSIYKNNISYQKLNLNSQKGNFEQDKAAGIAKKFFSDLGFDTTNLQLTGSTLEALVGYEIIRTLDPNQADFINLDFGYTFSGIPVVSPQLGINASVDISGQVTAFNFRGVGSVEQLNKYPLIKFNDALQQIQNNNGQVMSIEGLGEHASQVGTFDKVSLNSYYLAYFLPLDLTAPTQPIWVFEGTTTVKNLPAKVQIGVPAIPDKFFTKPETSKPGQNSSPVPR